MNRTDEQIIQGVLDEFMQICAIPHGSGQEKQLADMLQARLQRLGAAVRRDGLHNLWASLPASPGCPDQPVIALQAHLDMVCAGDMTGGVQPVRQAGGWLSTGGKSTLGADCGAGMALILWLLEQDLPHPPLRILLTAQEEIGINGARELPAESVQGVRDLINLDGFALSRILAGAAGGLREQYARPLALVPAPAGKAYRVALSGLSGGHSGFDIGEKRGNAILWLGALLRKLQTRMPFAIGSFTGGHAFNAIPYDSEAVIVTGSAAEEPLREFAQELFAKYHATDPNAQLTVQPCAAPAQVWSGADMGCLLTMLGGFADGVYQRGADGQVRDSSSLGRVYEADGQIFLDAMIRFMDPAAEAALRQSHSLVAASCGFACVHSTRYPVWEEKQDSPLIGQMQALHRQYTGEQAQVVCQHVGLELSYFCEKNPAMQCVSLGMDIEGCHSPAERWRLDSIPPLARMLAAYLEGAADAAKAP